MRKACAALKPGRQAISGEPEQTFGRNLFWVELLLWVRKCILRAGCRGVELCCFFSPANSSETPLSHTRFKWFFLPYFLQSVCNHIHFLPLSFCPNEHSACPLIDWVNFLLSTFLNEIIPGKHVRAALNAVLKLGGMVRVSERSDVASRVSSFFSNL